MSHSAVTLEELLGHFQETAAKWKAFFAANAGASEVATDITQSGNIGALVWHIYAASVRLRSVFSVSRSAILKARPR